MKLLVYILLVLPASLFSQQINISGTVTDFDFTSPLVNTSVVVKDNNTNEILGTDTTNNNGIYSITFIINSVNDPSLPEDFYLSNAFPNPHNPSTNLLFSTSVVGNYTVSIFNIIGERVYQKEFTLEAASYNFNISGLGSAGIYLFNISGDDINRTEKLILIDGGERNVNVELSSGSKYFNKKMDNELIVEFRRSGYEDKDTVVNLSPSIIIDAQIVQIPLTTSQIFRAEIGLLPTFHPGENLSVIENQGYFSGITNAGGIYDTAVTVSYITDPINPSNKIWTPEQFDVTVSGQNVQQIDTFFTINGNPHFWLTTMQQTPIQKEAFAFGGVLDENGDLADALVKIFDAGTNQFKDSTRSSASGFWSSNYFYQGYQYDTLDHFALIDSVRFEFSADDHYPLDTTLTFMKNLEVIAFLPQIPVPVYEFDIHLIDIGDGIYANDADVTIHWPDGDVTYTNNNGVISVSKELSGVNQNTNIPITHTNSTQYQPWMIGRTFETVQYGLEPIFQNADWTTDAEFPLITVDSLGAVYVGIFDKEVTTTFGGTLQTDGPEIVNMMNRLPGVVIHSKPRDGSGIYAQRNVQLEENWTTGEPADTMELNRARIQMQTVIDAYTLPVGIIMEVHNPIERLSITSPTWDLYYNQQGRENLNYTYVANVSPGNHVTWVQDPELRKKTSRSEYIGQPSAVVISELFAQYSNTSASSVYVAESSNGGLTQAAYFMLRVQAWMATWTIFDPNFSGDKPVFEPNKEYTSHSSGIDAKVNYEFKEK